MKNTIGKTISLFILLFSAVSISRQVNAQDLEGAQKTVQMFLDVSLNHQYGKENNDSYNSRVFHPDNNPLGISIHRNSIKEKLPSYKGYNVVTNAKIVDIYSTDEKVVPKQEKGELAYFAKIKFHTVGMTKNDELVALDNPIDIFEYIVLATDKTDGFIKIVDVYYSERQHFISLDYARKVSESFASDVDLPDGETIMSVLDKMRDK